MSLINLNSHSFAYWWQSSKKWFCGHDISRNSVIIYQIDARKLIFSISFEFKKLLLFFFYMPLVLQTVWNQRIVTSFFFFYSPTLKWALGKVGCLEHQFHYWSRWQQWEKSCMAACLALVLLKHNGHYPVFVGYLTIILVIRTENMTKIKCSKWIKSTCACSLRKV